MHVQILAAAVVLLMLGCESKKSSPNRSATGQEAAARAPRVDLADLTTASSLAAVRTAFNGHKGEARFLTLLAPT